MEQHYVVWDIKITEFFQTILSRCSGWESTNPLLRGHKNANWFSLPMGIGVVVVYLLGNCKLGARSDAGWLQESYCIWKQSCDCPYHLMKLVILQWFSQTHLALAPARVELNGMCLTCNILVFSSDTDLYTSSWDQYCLGRGRWWAVKPSLCTSLLD